ncbi:MAG TPA: flavin-nucleotide-binding protein [Synergistetes bacterium]|nr:flavin-nucleotide-binding protein [Synergistota bacterium]
MAEMTEAVQKLFAKVSTVVLSTADDKGVPNAVPVGAKRIIDSETILVSDQYLNKTLDNLKSNPRACLTFWEGIEGYQVKGSVSIETSGERFEETCRWIDKMSAKLGHPLVCKGVLIIKIEEIFTVTPGGDAGSKLA